MSYLKKVDIAAHLESVWTIWTNQKDAEKWLAPRANVIFEEGGAYGFFWNDDPKRDSTLGCKLLRIEPKQLLRFQWQGKTEFLPMFQEPHGPTEVEVRFSAHDNVTHVTVEQPETRDLPDWQAYDDWMASAWEYALNQLKAHCESRPQDSATSCC